MTRATRMTRDERRASIVEATMPLLEQHGQQLTTRQIAEAAGVAEGTIFRAFDSLQDVIDETLLTALSAETLTKLLEARPFPGTLDGDTAAALEVSLRYHEQVQALFHVAHTAPGREAAACARGQFLERHLQLANHLTERLTPHADELACPPDVLVELLLALIAGQQRRVALGLAPIDADTLARTLLDGTRRPA